jgi:transcription antitermination factor NusG
MLCMPSNTDDVRAPSDWHVVYTRHQHETAVDQILTSKGFKTFLPLYRSVRRWKDRIKVLSLPLFPSYMFVNGGLERRLDIMTTPGIHALVSTGGVPAAVPLAEIEAIRRATESGAKVEPHPFLKCGDWIRVKCGPLAGLRGILVRKKNLYRLVLAVEMLGKAAAVEVDGFLVERLNANPSGIDGRGYEAASIDLRPRIATCVLSYRRLASDTTFPKGDRQ